MPDLNAVRDAIQQLLDDYGDGWTLDSFVLVMGLERVTDGGEVDTAPWWIAPSSQPVWVTDGLIMALEDMRDTTVDQG